MSSDYNQITLFPPIDTINVSPLEPVGMKDFGDKLIFAKALSKASRIRDIFSFAELLVGSIKSSILLSREVRF